MILTTEDVSRLAHQARFALSAEDVERFCVELNSVLEQLELLRELDGLAPPGVPMDTTVRLRPDRCGSDPLLVSLETFAPELVAGFFTVPRVINNDSRPGS